MNFLRALIPKTLHNRRRANQEISINQTLLLNHTLFTAHKSPQNLRTPYRHHITGSQLLLADCSKDIIATHLVSCFEKILSYVLLQYLIYFQAKKENKQRKQKENVVKQPYHAGNFQRILYKVPFKSTSNPSNQLHLRAESTHLPSPPRQYTFSIYLASNIRGGIRGIQINLFLCLICQSLSVMYKCTKVTEKT